MTNDGGGLQNNWFCYGVTCRKTNPEYQLFSIFILSSTISGNIVEVIGGSELMNTNSATIQNYDCAEPAHCLSPDSSQSLPAAATYLPAGLLVSSPKLVTCGWLPNWRCFLEASKKLQDGPNLRIAMRTAGTATAKQCGHIIPYFTTISLSNGNSSPNYSC